MKRLNELNQLRGDVERLWTEPGYDPHAQPRGNLVPLTNDHEIDRLKAANDELNVSLDKATKRIHRLLGEKTQLRSLLEKRDEQIQKLNRELGMHLPAQDTAATQHVTSPARDPSKRFLAPIVDRWTTLFRRKANPIEKLAAGRPDPEVSPDFEVSNGKSTALVARPKGDIRQSIVIVVLLGLERDEIERLLPIVERDCSSRATTPLCLVDTDAFELLRRRELIFEYLPPADDRNRFDASLHWDLYLQRRLAVIRRKWDPVRIIAFGASAMSTLTLWSSSPFEDKPLPAVFEQALAS